MGFELSSFNMREEMEEGKFASDGTYVRSFDPHGVHDKWMDGVDEKEMKMARRRKRHQERLQKEKIKAEEKELRRAGARVLWRWTGTNAEEGETVLEALQRLGAQAKKQSSGKRSALLFLTSDMPLVTGVHFFKISQGKGQSGGRHGR